jgi:hypothetical protein
METLQMAGRRCAAPPKCEQSRSFALPEKNLSDNF